MDRDRSQAGPDELAPEDALAHTGSVDRRLPSWFPPVFYLALASVLLWRSLFAGETFLPAGLLGAIYPYRAAVHAEPPAWNPLKWDAIAQFYPWRDYAAATIRSGYLPLWNPYQFCGTPFLANSQSAVLYPLSTLFYVLPVKSAFGISAAIHLALCGWFAYLLFRSLRCSDLPALAGGCVYAFSAWQIAWLQLPTFLATSCWIPLALAQIVWLNRAVSNRQPESIRRAAALAVTLGLMLLAGHLQIAFYGLLAGTMAVGALALLGASAGRLQSTLRFVALSAAALALGMLLALPQILPAVELSRTSHRAVKPTAAGYAAYTEYAVPLSNLVTLAVPDFFGSPTDPARPYWNFYLASRPGGVAQPVRHNAAETALYVGLLPLLAGLIALQRLRTNRRFELRTAAVGGLALLALLLAIGSGLDAVLYFGVPGFGSSGSPGRALGLWALAWGGLCALGLESLRQRAASWREWSIALLVAGALCCVGLALLSVSLSNPLPRIPTFGDALQSAGWARLAIFAGCAAALLAPGAWQRLETLRPETGVSLAGSLAILWVVADLLQAATGANPTASPDQVYPSTPGIALLQQKSGHERIFPVNQRWSLYAAPPAVLPPNGATVYGLHDVQGYDSLLTGQYKAFANKLARPTPQGFLDASPPEVGNMVFAQNPNAPLAPTTAAAYAITIPPSAEGYAPESAPVTQSIYSEENEMAIYPLPDARRRAEVRAAGAVHGDSADWLVDQPTRQLLRTHAAGDLVIADQFYPGWHATIDGVPAEIDRDAEAGIFRRIPVSAGTHTVALAYQPTSFRVGLFAALAAIAGLASACGATPLRRNPATPDRI